MKRIRRPGESSGEPEQVDRRGNRLRVTGPIAGAIAAGLAVAATIGIRNTEPDEGKPQPTTTLAKAPSLTVAPNIEAFVTDEARNDRISDAINDAYRQLLPLKDQAEFGGSAYGDFSLTYEYPGGTEQPNQLTLHVRQGEHGELSSADVITVFGEGGYVTTSFTMGAGAVWETELEPNFGEAGYEASLDAFGPETQSEAETADDEGLRVLQAAVAAITAQGA